MMRTATKIKYLEKARDLISDKNNWCQGELAQDKDGNSIGDNDRRACKFCAVGAINRACRKDSTWEANTDTLRELLDKSLPKEFFWIESMNDSKTTGHTHRRIIGVFNRAIKRLKKEQG